MVRLCCPLTKGHVQAEVSAACPAALASTSTLLHLLSLHDNTCRSAMHRVTGSVLTR